MTDKDNNPVPLQTESGSVDSCANSTAAKSGYATYTEAAPSTAASSANQEHIVETDKHVALRTPSLHMADGES
jgi:hypothetical protein